MSWGTEESTHVSCNREKHSICSFASKQAHLDEEAYWLMSCVDDVLVIFGCSALVAVPAISEMICSVLPKPICDD